MAMEDGEKKSWKNNHDMPGKQFDLDEQVDFEEKLFTVVETFYQFVWFDWLSEVVRDLGQGFLFA